MEDLIKRLIPMYHVIMDQSEVPTYPIFVNILVGDYELFKIDVAGSIVSFELMKEKFTKIPVDIELVENVYECGYSIGRQHFELDINAEF